MHEIGEDHLLARRRVGQADAAGCAIVHALPNRALRGQLGVRQREQGSEAFGLKAANAKAHGVLQLAGKDIGFRAATNHPISAPDS